MTFFIETEKNLLENLHRSQKKKTKAKNKPAFKGTTWATQGGTR
jgi:hypothetical protein